MVLKNKKNSNITVTTKNKLLLNKFLEREQHLHTSALLTRCCSAGTRKKSASSRIGQPNLKQSTDLQFAPHEKESCINIEDTVGSASLETSINRKKKIDSISIFVVTKQLEKDFYGKYFPF